MSLAQAPTRWGPTVALRAAGWARGVSASTEKEALPVTDHACSEKGMWLMQNMPLADERDMVQIVEAIAKVQRAAGSPALSLSSKPSDSLAGLKLAEAGGQRGRRCGSRHSGSAHH